MRYPFTFDGLELSEDDAIEMAFEVANEFLDMLADTAPSRRAVYGDVEIVTFTAIEPLGGGWMRYSGFAVVEGSPSE